MVLSGRLVGLTCSFIIRTSQAKAAARSRAEIWLIMRSCNERTRRTLLSPISSNQAARPWADGGGSTCWSSTQSSTPHSRHFGFSLQSRDDVVLTTLRTPIARREHYIIPGLQGESEMRSEEHTSELQSRFDLVCRLLLE